MTAELRQLRAFVAVAEELSFRRAGERLRIAQPALTRAVRALEAVLGARLFERTTRRVELTEVGAAFLPEARLAVEHAERAVAVARDVAAGTRGRLNVAYTHASISGPVPELVTRFRAAHPQVRVTLQDMWTDRQAVALVERSIDVGFAMPAVIRPQFEYRVVKAEPWVAVLPEDHPLARAPTLELQALRHEPFIFGTWDRWRHFREMINEMCVTHAGFVPRVAQEESEVHVILGLVAARVGVTIYPECIRNNHRLGLAIRPLAGPLPSVQTLAVWHRDDRSEVVAGFVRIIETMIGARPGAEAAARARAGGPC